MLTPSLAEDPGEPYVCRPVLKRRKCKLFWHGDEILKPKGVAHQVTHTKYAQLCVCQS